MPKNNLKSRSLKKGNTVKNRKAENLESIRQFDQGEASGNIPIKYIASVLDNAQEAIVVMQDEIHKYVNKRASEIDGRSIDELIGKHMRETTHPDDYAIAFQSPSKEVGRLSCRQVPLSRYQQEWTGHLA